MLFQVLVHIECIQILGVKACEQHIHDDDDVDLILVRHVMIGILLILDPLLDILIVQIKCVDGVVSAIPRIVVVDDVLQGDFFLLRFLLVVCFFLNEILL